MQVIHQKFLLDIDFPLLVFITDTQEFPPHWHEAVEIVYALEDHLKIGVNHETHMLKARDIILIGGGDVHFFPPQSLPIPRLIIQFDLSFYESFSTLLRDKRLPAALLRESTESAVPGEPGIHSVMERQLLEIMKESEQKHDGYKLALKARMFDLLILLLRRVPMESLSSYEKSRRLGRLARLDKVLLHVEQHFERTILLEEVADVANFSVFHFTRFFRETTGLTFGQYVNQYRIAKAIDYLVNSSDTITEIVYKSGFSNAKTFNRVFRQIKGCSPTVFKKAVSEV